MLRGCTQGLGTLLQHAQQFAQQINVKDTPNLLGRMNYIDQETVPVNLQFLLDQVDHLFRLVLNCIPLCTLGHSLTEETWGDEVAQLVEHWTQDLIT